MLPSRLRRARVSRPMSASLYASRRSEASRLNDDPNRPEHALVVYGTLAPGQENHHLLADLPGEWSEVVITGEVGEWEGYPMFRWSDAGEQIAAWLLQSSELPAHYDRLDEFETDAYVRLLVPYAGSSGGGVANCYVAADPSS
jgi:gamma-glutamylcyclotransferase (GGCT)/AIG2-like uncharacterized protein YtfP